MMENEIILPKEKLDMTVENLTNMAPAELAETIKTDAFFDDEKQQEAFQEVAVDVKTETAPAIPTDPSAARSDAAMVSLLEENREDILEENPEENLEEKLSAAIEALERNLEETIKEGNKERPAAIREIINDEVIKEPQENPDEPDPRAGKVRATPAARRIAREFKVAIEKATGTGPNGRIEVDDVKKLVVIQPGTFDYKSIEPVVIGTRLDKIAGNPSNIFATPVELEEIPAKKTVARKKLKDMNQKIEKLPNPELDFVPFVDQNDEKPEVKDADVVTKISALDFVPFVDLKAEPLREEIIVKPTPMHLLYESDQQDVAVKNRKPRGLPRKNQLQDKNKVATQSDETGLPTVTEAPVSETQSTAGNEASDFAITNKIIEAPVVIATETDQTGLQEPELSVDQAEDKLTQAVIRPKAVRKYLVKNKMATPVISLTTEIDMTEIKDLRKKIAKKIEEQARYRCTYTDFLLLATARALVKHPLLNSSRKDDALMAQTQVNLGLTVESEQGLIVPVIKNTQMMNFVEIVKSRGDLLKAVKNKHLPPDQLSGSTFTITNLGMYGIRDFTAIINQNNSAILSVGEVVQRIRIHQGEPVVRSVMKISLNLDQRVANGVDGAKFLQEIKADMENPPLLLF